MATEHPYHQRVVKKKGVSRQLAGSYVRSGWFQKFGTGVYKRLSVIPVWRGGNYFQVLTSLGLDKDILKLASDDDPGRKIQNAGLSVRTWVAKE